MLLSIYGDSILKGVLFEQGRYTVNREYEQSFARRQTCAIRNRSVFGATLEKGLALLRRDAEKGVCPGDYVLLEFGGNDCDFCWQQVAEAPAGEHVCRVPTERFAALLQEAIRLVRTLGSVPLTMTLPPIDPERYLTHICRNGLSRERILQWLGDVTAIYRWQEQYSRLTETVARSLGVVTVDVRSAFLRRRQLDNLLCADGIHPSRSGQKLIYDTFCRHADGMLIPA